MKTCAASAVPRDAVSAQERLLPFLLNPLSYPHRPRSVRLIQTHASFVFIAPPFVFKVKKPVNFGFLDYSTLEKRRHFCEREVALNRRLCPEVYLGIVPISVKNGRFTFGKGAEVVEYAVRMRQLSERRFLDKLVQRDEVVPGDLDRVVHVLKQFYQAQEPSEKIEAWGHLDRLRISTDENFRQARPFIGHTLSRTAFETIRSYTNQFFRCQAGLFAARVRQKWIRDCHGDLHLEHLHVTPRAVHIYDCIEFNDRFRYIDVANDVAFLAMDLDYEGRPELSGYFVRHMASALKDDDLPRLLDFYKCYRAFVRGKVESLHSLAHASPETERQASAERARRYFRLALQYAVARSRPFALVVMGRIAAGKSTLAKALSLELGWPVYSSDYIRKQMAGFPLYQRSAVGARKCLYSAAMTAKTYQRLLADAVAQLRQGHSVILDATFARRAQRKLLAKVFQQAEAAWGVLEAQAPSALVKQRLRLRETSPAEVSDARLEDFAVLTGLYEPPIEIPARQLAKIATSGSLKQTTAKALRRLTRLQIESSRRP